MKQIIILLITIMCYSCSSIVTPENMDVPNVYTYSAVQEPVLDITQDFNKRNCVYRIAQYDKYVSNMHYRIFTGSTSAPYGALVINTINITLDSLQCEYYKKQ